MEIFDIYTQGRIQDFKIGKEKREEKGKRWKRKEKRGKKAIFLKSLPYLDISWIFWAKKFGGEGKFHYVC